MEAQLPPSASGLLAGRSCHGSAAPSVARTSPLRDGLRLGTLGSAAESRLLIGLSWGTGGGFRLLLLRRHHPRMVGAGAGGLADGPPAEQMEREEAVLGGRGRAWPVAKSTEASAMRTSGVISSRASVGKPKLDCASSAVRPSSALKPRPAAMRSVSASGDTRRVNPTPPGDVGRSPASGVLRRKGLRPTL